MSVSSSPPKPRELKDGRYTLLGQLGEGSQGETYEARDNGPSRDRDGHRPRPRPESLVEDWNKYVAQARAGEAPRASELVAIKCFRVNKAKAWKDVELAEREARTLASLDHPRLPKYIEHFEEDGALYLVMEKIEGESLASLRARKRTLSVAEVTKMLEDIAEALGYLHGRAPFIVHRDIKPGNIIRRPDGSYALVDFGAVRDRLKPAGGSTIVGTFGYMAPEQFQGRASPKSDIYGLGATAIAMLTGCEPEDLPHEGLGIDVARALPKGTGTPLVRALTAMLQPDPDRRVESVDDALAFLKPAQKNAVKAAPRVDIAPPQHLTRQQKRELRRQQKRLAREEWRKARALARARRAPFVPRVFAKLGLFIATVAVWIAVGLVTPLVLVLLSLVFGERLRRAARHCMRAARRAQNALGRASHWLSGHRAENVDSGFVRVATDLDRVRAVTETEAQAIAIAQAEARGENADEWLEQKIAEESERRRLEEKDEEEAEEARARLRRRSIPSPHAKRRE